MVPTAIPTVGNSSLCRHMTPFSPASFRYDVQWTIKQAICKGLIGQLTPLNGGHDKVALIALIEALDGFDNSVVLVLVLV